MQCLFFHSQESGHLHIFPGIQRRVATEYPEALFHPLAFPSEVCSVSTTLLVLFTQLLQVPSRCGNSRTCKESSSLPGRPEDADELHVLRIYPAAIERNQHNSSVKDDSTYSNGNHGHIVGQINIVDLFRTH